MNLNTLRTQYRDRILALAAANKATNVRVFGSVARGDAREDSDVDFLVTFAPDASLFDIAGLYADLEDLLGRHVDVVPDDSIKPLLKPYIMRDVTFL